jgi:hypothetical protein
MTAVRNRIVSALPYLAVAVIAAAAVKLADRWDSPAAAQGAKGEPASDKLVRTERIEIIDVRGKQRIVLTTGRNGTPVFALLDEGGNVRMVAGTTATGAPSFSLLNGDKKIAATLTAAENGETQLQISDAAGRTRVTVGVDAAGDPLIQQFDAEGKSLGR